MNNIKNIISNNKLLAVVLITYIILALLMPNKSVEAIQNSMFYVKEMLLIMPVILLLTSLITAWVPRKAIENNFGKNSGIKGSIYSFILGSFSAGPIYAAFPVCKALLAKGASIANIVILLCTWAVIKVPMLLNEAKFLSPQFMLIRWILTTISIFIMGYISSKLVKIEDIPSVNIDTISEKNKITISYEYCIGCGLCAKIAPSHFEIINKKAAIIKQDILEKDADAIQEAVEKCPSKIISFIK